MLIYQRVCFSRKTVRWNSPFFGPSPWGGRHLRREGDVQRVGGGGDGQERGDGGAEAGDLEEVDEFWW